MTVPPVEERRRKLLAVWLGVAVLFGALLGVARAARTGLDDPDPAWQRPGFLDAGPLPEPAPRVTEDVPRPGRPAVVFFVRPEGVAELCHSLATHRLGESAEMVMVVSGTGRCPGVTTLEDPSGAPDIGGFRGNSQRPLLLGSGVFFWVARTPVPSRWGYSGSPTTAPADRAIWRCSACRIIFRAIATP